MNTIISGYKKEIYTLIGLIFIVAIVSTLITYRQLSSSLSETYLDKLSTLKSSLVNYVTNYMSYNEKVLISLSSSGTATEALKELDNSFSLIENEYSKKLDKRELLAKIESYISKINYGVPGAQTKREADEYLPKNTGAQIIQSLYLAKSPFGTNDKYKLYSSQENLSYDKSHKKYHNYFLNELKQYDFYDIFLINLNGDIVYSVFKEHDFGTNLLNGVYKKTSLADAFKKALTLEKNGVAFSDFTAYEPSYDKPAAFMATPLYSDGKIAGVIAIQLSMENINRAMTFDEKQQDIGLGSSGEAYLVGDDYYMRSNSRFLSDIDNSLVNELSTTIGIIKAKTKSVQKALDGEDSAHVDFDYRGKKVYSSFAPIDVMGKRWAILVEADEEEVARHVNKTVIAIIFTSIIMTLLFLALVWYVLLRLILKPMRMQEQLLSENVALKTRELGLAQTILSEYKKAVDMSSIVSKASPSGIITYVNDAFCEISGYSREELLGKPHNVIRHPEMSKDVFRDMWNTILNKRVWKGVIKNLKKGGDEYYVNSTIIPIIGQDGEIKEFISIRNDITELTRKEKLIIEQTIDHVTSLPNRQKMLEDINKQDFEMKLAIIQINKFKEVNDFYGIEIGDLLLVNFSSILRKMVNENGTSLYRIGGDEFAVLEFGSISAKDFTKIITNIIKYFDHNTVSASDNSFNVSITAGVSAGEGSTLFFNSEMTLRKAIENSKSLLSYENSYDIEIAYKNNIAMTTKIKDAIKNDNIVIYVQPIIANPPDKKEKFECLIRMIDDGKVISPFFFLDIAKKARLYPTLTKIVIEKSFTHFRDSQSEFSINLSIEDILDEDIVSFLKRKISEYRVGHRLILEIVESEGIENFDDIDRFIKDIKKLGCRIAIDDFGTGYSNFEYLMKLSADFIKIDGSLIKNLDHNENSEVVVELIVNFAKQMNIKTIAEFVHNDAVYQKVKSMGIDYMQGYLLGEPAPFIE